MNPLHGICGNSVVEGWEDFFAIFYIGQVGWSFFAIFFSIQQVGRNVIADPIQSSARRSAAFHQTPWSQQMGGRHAPKPGRRLARHPKVFVAHPTAPSPQLRLSARLPQIVQQLPPALVLPPSVHQPHLNLTERSATEVLAPVSTEPAQALPAKISACCRAPPRSPTTQSRLALLTVRILRAPVLLPSTWSCLMVTSAGRPEVLDTAVRAAAVSVEVIFNLFML